jgi:hypothetical protein
MAARRQAVGVRMRRLVGCTLIVLGALGVLAGLAGAAARHRVRPRQSRPISIVVLSGRADLVTGGSALVALQPASAGRRLRVLLGRRNITRDFGRRTGGDYAGLVTGLRRGRNVLRALLPNGSGARLVLTDHPTSGPLFSGPQIEPWTCQPTAVDRGCDQPPAYSFLYKSTDPRKRALQPYDPADPPNDVATTTTDRGVRVPFIVRVETGYQDRDMYQIATLFQRGTPWTWDAPQRAWNHKLLVLHGAGCGTDYGVSAPYSVTAYNPVDDIDTGMTGQGNIPLGTDTAVDALGRGFMTMVTALDNNGVDCGVVLQAESLVMAKQHIETTYGLIRYTIGIGCSGGSLAQQWIANAYPGVYQGLLVSCSFPDVWSTATQLDDYRLTLNYFQTPSKWETGVPWSPTQMAEVQDSPSIVNSEVGINGFFFVMQPSSACAGTTAADRYDPTSNPGGVRCSIQDWSVDQMGRRPASVWNPQEQKIGHGFAGLPIDNIGVQYGLEPLLKGEITAAQFVDLNAKIGGLDIDANPTATRMTADLPALANAYRTGLINEANNLSETPIIDCRGPDPGFFHDAYRAFALRARLDRNFGNHADQLIWEGPAPIIGSSECADQSLHTMDAWLGAVTQDSQPGTTAQKLARDEPADATDRCFPSPGGATSTTGLCGPAIVPIYGSPRMAAGQPITTDENKCQLKPLARSDYRTVAFTASEWAELERIFPTGVCDWSKPGVDQRPTVPWLSYQTTSGSVIYGGRPLGAPLQSTPIR